MRTGVTVNVSASPGTSSPNTLCPPVILQAATSPHSGWPARFGVHTPLSGLQQESGKSGPQATVATSQAPVSVLHVKQLLPSQAIAAAVGTSQAPVEVLQVSHALPAHALAAAVGTSQAPVEVLQVSHALPAHALAAAVASHAPDPVLHC